MCHSLPTQTRTEQYTESTRSSCYGFEFVTKTEQIKRPREQTFKSVFSLYAVFSFIQFYRPHATTYLHRTQ